MIQTQLVTDLMRNGIYPTLSADRSTEAEVRPSGSLTTSRSHSALTVSLYSNVHHAITELIMELELNLSIGSIGPRLHRLTDSLTIQGLRPITHVNMESIALKGGCLAPKQRRIR